MTSPTLQKVLYIEDDPHIRKLVQLTLEEHGQLRVRCCGSWNEAVDLLRDEVPDLFLLDVMLPEKDGGQTLLQLRTLPGLAHIPAIFLTVDVDLTSTDTSGLSNYSVIPKPFQVERLCASLQAHWEKLTAQA